MSEAESDALGIDGPAGFACKIYDRDVPGIAAQSVTGCFDQRVLDTVAAQRL